MKKLITILFCSTLFASVSSQITEDPINIFDRIRNVPSPTAASLGEYVDIPVSLYAGLPEIDIPIYEIDLGNYKLPVSLSYHASGIRIVQEASWVGLGWALNAGGIITQSIRRINDLQNNGYPNQPPIPDFEEDDPAPGSDVDTEPDIFSYNFAGYSGKFCIRKDKSIFLLTPENQLKIELIKESPATSNIPYYWIITTPDGVQYTFFEKELKKTSFRSFEGIQNEWNYKSLDFENPLSVFMTQQFVSTWFLNKITLPNREEINFSYFKGYYSIKSPIYTSHSQTDALGTIYGNSYPYYASTTFSCDITVQEPILKEITWKYGKMTFLLSDRKDLRNSKLGNSIDNSNRHSKKLDEIQIYPSNRSNLVKRIKFHHSYFGNIQNPDSAYILARLKLDSLSISGSDMSKHYGYSFGYDVRKLPPKNSYICDIWGYCNYPEGHALSMIPADTVPAGTTFTFDPTGLKNENEVREKMKPLIINKDMPFIGGVRDCNPRNITVAMLTDIRYPTGGTTTFTYEANQYYDKQKKKMMYGGGVRIARICNPAYTKEYRYTFDDGTNSGTIISPPQCSLYSTLLESEWFVAKSVSVVLERFSSSQGPMAGAINGQSIGYSQVKEILSDRNGQIIEESLFHNEPEVLHGFLEFPNRENFSNGKLKEHRYYNRNKLIRKTIFEYDTRYLDSIRAHKINNFKHGDYYFVRSGWCRTSRKKEINYIHTGGETYTMEQQETYTHNRSTYMLEKITSDLSDGGTLEQRFRYTADIPNGIYPEMRERHILNLPVESRTYKNGKTIGGKLFTYQKIDDKFLPHHIFTRKNNTSLVSTNFYNGSETSFPDFNPPVTFRSFDCMGNCIEYVPENGIPIIYIWGANAPYPVAVIQNATLEEVKQLIDFDKCVTGKQTVDNYFINRDLPKALIETYTYNKLIGVTRVSKPGFSRYTDFEYDAFGHLRLVLDVRGHILKNFEYKYSSEN